MVKIKLSEVTSKFSHYRNGEYHLKIKKIISIDNYMIDMVLIESGTSVFQKIFKYGKIIDLETELQKYGFEIDVIDMLVNLES